MNLRWIPLLAALCVGGVASAQSTTRLKWKFDTTKQRTEITRTVTSVSMDMMGQTMDSAQDQTIWTVYKVVSVKDGVATVEKTVKRVLTKVDNPQLGKFTYDTDKKDELPEGMGAMVAQQTLQLVGAKVTLKMNDTGKVLDVSVDEKLKNLPNAGNVEQMARQGAVAFPADLTVGKSFEQVMDMPQNGMQIKTTTTFTYKGKKKGLDSFDVTQKMDMTPGPNMPVQLTVKKQTSEGHLRFDSAAGWTKSFKVRLNMNMSITAPQGELKQDMEVLSESKVVDGVDTKTIPGGEKKKEKKEKKAEEKQEEPQEGDF